MQNPFELKQCLFPRGQAGLCCDKDGVALGPVTLVEKCNAVPGKRYRICSPEVFVKAFMIAYGKPPLDVIMHLWQGIGRMTKSLEDGDVPLAMIKAIHLKFPEIEPENMAKLEAGELAKAGYNPDEPHDEQGRWTGDGAAGGAANNMEEVVVTAHRIHGVDREQLTAWEGGQKTEGYIPHDKYGNIVGHSGVTVGTGVDLGHHNSDELFKAGVSPALVEKLNPYLLQTKEAAQAVLEEKGPLRLTQAEADELDNAFYQKHYKEVQTKYNADVDAANAADKKNGKTPKIERAHLDDLHSEMQTTVISTTYNMGADYGSSEKSKLKQKLWHDLIDNNSIEAESSLRSLGSPEDNPHEHHAVRNRRIKEANYLSGYNHKKSKPE